MNNDNICDKYSFLILSSLILPLSIIAPVALWLPGTICGLVMFIFTKKKKIFLSKVSTVEIIWLLLVTYAILSSIWSIGRSFFYTHVHEILVLSFILRILYIKSLYLKNKEYYVKAFCFSLVITCFFLLIDFSFSLGIKPWLSIYFDQLINQKPLEVNSYSSFKEVYIKGSFIGSYSRGLSTICIFSFLFLMLYKKYNHKYLLMLAIIMLPLILGENMTVKVALLCTFIFSLLIYFKKKFFFRVFIFLFAIYYFSAPWTLNVFKNTNYNEYRKNIALKSHENNKEIIRYNLDPTLKSYIDFIKVKIKYSFYGTIGKMSHRLVIWHHTSNAIFEDFFWGKGIFSSRILGKNEKINLKHFYFATEKSELSELDGINWSKTIIDDPDLLNQYLNSLVIKEKDYYYPTIPLHPHNNALQIWLELGLFGMIIFFLLFYKIWSLIIFSKNITDYQASILSGSLFSIFIINQSSYGLWQIWWISAVVMLFIFSNIFLKKNLSPKGDYSNS